MNGTNQCNGYLEHLQAKHRRLNGALSKVRHILAEPWQNPEMRQAARESLETLQEELKSHFAEEEYGGCLEEAAARCSSVRAEVKTLLHEHQALTASLAALTTALDSPTVEQPAWQQRYEAFVCDLKAHELAENRLVQFAFGGDAADHDEEGNE